MADRPLPVFKIAAALALLAGGIAWGVKSGFFERLGDSGEGARTKQLAEFKKYQEQKAAEAAHARAESLAGIKAELARQEVIAAQALTNLQEFLEKGGSAVLSVRRESLEAVRRKAREDLAEAERALAAKRDQEQALAALRTRSVAYNSVSKSIPSDGVVAATYKALEAEAAKMKEMSGKFTDKHPSVVAQKAEFNLALKNFFAAVDSSLNALRVSAADLEGRVAELRGRDAEIMAQFESVARDQQVAQLRQQELERAREREADRLMELRRREFDVQFGAISSATNGRSVK